MKVVGRHVPPKPPVDKRVYTAICHKCNAILEFTRESIFWYYPEPTTYKGEFNKTCRYTQSPYYAVRCPEDNEIIYLGKDERAVLLHLKNKREKEKALRDYDAVHDVEYD